MRRQLQKRMSKVISKGYISVSLTYFNFKIIRNFIKTSCMVYRNMLKWYRTIKVYVS